MKRAIAKASMKPQTSSGSKSLKTRMPMRWVRGNWGVAVIGPSVRLLSRRAGHLHQFDVDLGHAAFGRTARGVEAHFDTQGLAVLDEVRHFRERHQEALAAAGLLCREGAQGMHGKARELDALVVGWD